MTSLFYFQKLSVNEVERQSLFLHFLENEVSFRNDLRQTIASYAQPLKADVVTHEQHKILFQNIDQVCLHFPIKTFLEKHKRIRPKMMQHLY